jgi:quercetin dioxygenase-like cupin family protein
MNMELSERFMHTLEAEGFVHVYEWQDAPGKIYEPHVHTDKVSFCVTDGSITFDFGDYTHTVHGNERFDVPIGKKHSAVVGPQGVIYIVGEMVEST